MTEHYTCKDCGQPPGKCICKVEAAAAEVLKDFRFPPTASRRLTPAEKKKAWRMLKPEERRRINDELLKEAAGKIIELTANARSMIRQQPLDCQILKGKYKGRLAKVDGMIACERRGLLILAMVYKLKRGYGDFNGYIVDRSNVLNSDGESRQYRSLDEIEILWK